MAGPDEHDRRVLPEPAPVWVWKGDTWHPGWMTEWNRWADGAGWRAYCRWPVGVGQGHVGHVLADQVRPRDVD